MVFTSPHSPDPAQIEHVFPVLKPVMVAVYQDHEYHPNFSFIYSSTKSVNPSKQYMHSSSTSSNQSLKSDLFRMAPLFNRSFISVRNSSNSCCFAAAWSFNIQIGLDRFSVRYYAHDFKRVSHFT